MRQGFQQWRQCEQALGLFELCTAKSVVNSLSAGMYECTYSAMKTDKDGFMVAESGGDTEKVRKGKLFADRLWTWSHGSD